MSVTSGGQALKSFKAGGNTLGSAGSAGMSTTFVTAHRSPPSRCHSQMEEDRSLRLTTQLTKPYALVGSWAGRSSKTSWYSAPKSISCTWRRRGRSQKWRRRPYLPPSRSCGTSPSSNMSGVPHSLVTAVS